MTADEKLTLQARLTEVFEEFDLDVAVGVTRIGVAIRSQTPEVDATVMMVVTAQERDRMRGALGLGEAE